MPSPIGHVLWNTNQRLTSDDLNADGIAPIQMLMAFFQRFFKMEELEANPAGLQGSMTGFFGSDCLVEVDDGLDLVVRPGLGLHHVNPNDLNPFPHPWPAFEPPMVPIVIPEAVPITIEAHSAGPRVDLVYLVVIEVNEEPDTRAIWDAGAGQFNPESVDTWRRFAVEIAVVKGTADQDYVNAPPSEVRGDGSGNALRWTVLAEVEVPATSGAVTVRDLRGRLALVTSLTGTQVSPSNVITPTWGASQPNWCRAFSSFGWDVPIGSRGDAGLYTLHSSSDTDPVEFWRQLEFDLPLGFVPGSHPGPGLTITAIRASVDCGDASASGSVTIFRAAWGLHEVLPETNAAGVAGGALGSLTLGLTDGLEIQTEAVEIPIEHGYNYFLRVRLDPHDSRFDIGVEQVILEGVALRHMT